MTNEEQATEPQFHVPLPGGDGPAPTVEQPTYQTFAAPEAAPAGNGYLDDDEEWVSAAPKGLRVRIPTGALLLLLFTAGGLWGGSILQKHQDKSKTSSAATAGAAGGGAAARRAAAGGGGAGAAGAGAAGAGATGAAGRGATAGIVTDIQGSTVYLTDANGNLVKITTSPSSTVTKSTPGTLADLQAGQTVFVTGPKAADGSTTARSIIISPAGAAGLGAGGTGGGGPPTGATGGGAGGGG